MGVMLRDLYFIVVKDFLNKQLQGYDDILPIKGFSKTEEKLKKFILLFDKSGVKFEVMAEIGLLTYQAKLIHEIPLSGSVVAPVEEVPEAPKR